MLRKVWLLVGLSLQINSLHHYTVVAGDSRLCFVPSVQCFFGLKHYLLPPREKRMFEETSNNGMAMVNHLMNVKDSRWLQVEVCREFQRGQCSRTDQECKFAHPPPHVEVQNGKVTACYDSIKVKKFRLVIPRCEVNNSF